MNFYYLGYPTTKNSFTESTIAQGCAFMNLFRTNQLEVNFKLAKTNGLPKYRNLTTVLNIPVLLWVIHLD